MSLSPDELTYDTSYLTILKTQRKFLYLNILMQAVSYDQVVSCTNANMLLS